MMALLVAMVVVPHVPRPGLGRREPLLQEHQVVVVAVRPAPPMARCHLCVSDQEDVKKI